MSEVLADKTKLKTDWQKLAFSQLESTQKEWWKGLQQEQWRKESEDKLRKEFPKENQGSEEQQEKSFQEWLTQKWEVHWKEEWKKKFR